MNIRPAEPTDPAAMARIYAPLVTGSPISFEEEPPSVEEFARRVASVTRTHPWFVAEDAGEIAGYAYGSKHRERAAYRWAADSSVYVAASHRRRGIGRALYETLFVALRELGFLRVYAGVVVPNAASEALHEAVGFREIGTYRAVGFKFGRWHDVRWYGLSLGECAQPAEPRRPGGLASYSV